MILLDTHAWIWWADGSQHLSAKARRAIEGAREVGISPISCWEVAMLVRKGRLTLDRDVLIWIKQALLLPKTRLVPVSPEIAVRAASFGPEFLGDPADRLIAASCIESNGRLVTRDTRLQDLPELKTTW